jgi:hypothetical protein
MDSIASAKQSQVLRARRDEKVELVSKLVLVALVIGAVWWMLQPRYVFVVRIAGGVPRATRGKVTAAFLQQIGQACAEHKVSRGWIGGVLRGRRGVALAFSRGMPPPCRQRLRNLWTMLG